MFHQGKQPAPEGRDRPTGTNIAPAGHEKEYESRLSGVTAFFFGQLFVLGNKLKVLAYDNHSITHFPTTYINGKNPRQAMVIQGPAFDASRADLRFEAASE